MKSLYLLMLVLVLPMFTGGCASTRLYALAVSNDPGKAIMHLQREGAFMGAAVADWVLDDGDGATLDSRIAFVPNQGVLYLGPPAGS